MKKLGSIAEFGAQRDRELMDAFRHQLRHGSYHSLSEYFYNAAKMPASRFWVSERRAYVVIKKMLRGQSLEKMFLQKQEMFKEILRRVKAAMEADPALSLYSATFDAVNSPAPEFYLSPKSARVLIYKLRHDGCC